MNKAYRQGYRDGIAQARTDTEINVSLMSYSSLQRHVQRLYGMRNSADVNSRKVGFRDGYAAGLDSAAIATGRIRTRAWPNSEKGFNVE